MNRATRPALLNSQANPFNLRATLFHSSPVLDRRRRTHWDSGGGAFRDSSWRFNPYAKRFRKLQSKQTLLRNVSAFAEHLFQGWRSGFDEYDPSSSQGSSGFRHEYEAKGPCRSGFDEYDPFSSQGSSGFRHEYRAKGPKRAWTGTKGPHSTGRSTFHFCEDDDDVETIFRSAFGGNQYFYWSFIEEDFPRWRNSSGNYDNYRTSWNRRHQEEEDYDYSTDSDSSESDLAAYRLVLGLSSSGPLRLDDVKNAYRTCALKWHPDRHQGSSKAVAEEKFKACSAAYQSLCDKMAFH